MHITKSISVGAINLFLKKLMSGLGGFLRVMMTMRANASPWLGAFALILVPISSNANAGIPLVGLGLPFLCLALVPVVLIEAWIIKRRWLNFQGRIVSPLFVANIVSTFVGYPIAWALLLLLALITGSTGIENLATTQGLLTTLALQSAWLPPHEGQMRWLIPAAGLVSLIPTFFISVYLEVRILIRFLGAEAKARTRDFVIANLATYSLLAALLVSMLVAGL
jgi:hypothetical protein